MSSSDVVQLKEFFLKLYRSQLHLGLCIGRKKYIKIVSSSTRTLLSLFSILLAISLSIEQKKNYIFCGQTKDELKCDNLSQHGYQRSVINTLTGL